MDERENIIQYRLERAREALAEAEVLADTGHWNGCVNRLYYSCFYAVNALLLRHDLAFSKHAGIRSLFNRHFVKIGLVSPKLGDLYGILFNARNHGDYSDLARFDEVSVRPLLSQAGAFISEIGALEASASDSLSDSKENGDG